MAQVLTATLSQSKPNPAWQGPPTVPQGYQPQPYQEPEELDDEEIERLELARAMKRPDFNIDTWRRDSWAQWDQAGQPSSSGLTSQERREPLVTGGPPLIEEWDSDEDARSVVTRVAVQMPKSGPPTTTMPVPAKDLQEAAQATSALLHPGYCWNCSKASPCPACISYMLKARTAERRAAQPAPGEAAGPQSAGQPSPMATEATVYSQPVASSSSTLGGWQKLNEQGLGESF